MGRRMNIGRPPNLENSMADLPACFVRLADQDYIIGKSLYLNFLSRTTSKRA